MRQDVVFGSVIEKKAPVYSMSKKYIPRVLATI